MESEEVSIKEVLENLKRRWKMIAIIVLVCLIVASVYSFFITKPVFKISTKLFIGKEATGHQITIVAEFRCIKN